MRFLLFSIATIHIYIHDIFSSLIRMYLRNEIMLALCPTQNQKQKGFRNSVTGDSGDVSCPSRSMGDAFRSVVDFCIIYQGCLVKRSVRVNRKGC